MSHKIGVEVLDDEGLPCVEGQQGKLVLTDYMNIQSPIIRYDVGDRAAPGRCDCGRIKRPALQTIEGKVTGTFLLGDGRRVLFNSLKAELRDLPMVARFQIVQETLNDFTFNYVLREHASAVELPSQVQKILCSQVGPGARVTCVEKSEISRSAAGKAQATLSRV